MQEFNKERFIVRFLFLIPLAFLFLIASCTTKADFASEYEWLNKKCSQCHETKELATLYIQAKAMGQQEFADKLDGMVHGNLRLSDADKIEAVRLIKRLKENEKRR
jgi:hypothetical protein